jgi:hypothetical protein
MHRCMLLRCLVVNACKGGGRNKAQLEVTFRRDLIGPRSVVVPWNGLLQVCSLCSYQKGLMRSGTILMGVLNSLAILCVML